MAITGRRIVMLSPPAGGGVQRGRYGEGDGCVLVVGETDDSERGAQQGLAATPDSDAAMTSL